MIKVYCDFCELPSISRMGSVELDPRWLTGLASSRMDNRYGSCGKVRKDICKDCAKTLELTDE